MTFNKYQRKALPVTYSDFIKALNLLNDQALSRTDTIQGTKRVDSARRNAIEYAESGLLTLPECLDLFKSSGV